MLAACQNSTTEPQAITPTVAASASALTATSGAPAHDLYASKGITCDACHPCGKRLPGGHTVPWMDQASAGFHAASANAGLATCQGCHGTALDGVGGTTTISCAQCHGASWSTNCTLCHGGADNTTGAPPRATWGNQADAVRAGTHSAHVSAAHSLAAPVSCALCHPVPTDAFTAGHIDGGTAEVTFAGLAAPGAGVTASWDRTQATCTNTYCHGATVGGGTVKTPTWTTTDGSARACNACHGAPPPAPHPASSSCGTCHSGYTATTVNAATHIDGQVQVTANHAAGYATGSVHGKDANLGGLAGCKSCHGADLAGGSVGVSCTACHAKTGFGTWDTTCTFCHGNPTTGVQNPPVDVQGRAVATNVSVGLHEAHVTTTLTAPLTCVECHPARATSVITDAAHIDGDGVAEIAFGALATTGGVAPVYTRTSDTAATCGSTYCHGNFTGGANATVGWTDTAQVTCASCHGAPPPAPHPTNTSCGICHAGYTSTSVTAATHIDGKVQVTANHAAGYATGSVHGKDANLGGLAGCKSCHGADLAGGSVNVSCNACHATKGFSTWDTTCTFCHGNATTGVQSPPVDIQGRSVATNVSVGLHQSHVTTTLTAPLTCVQCHPARTASVITDVAHIDGDGVAEIAFGALATTGGAAAVYTRTSDTAATCGSTYCHGNFTGGANATVGWTDTAQVTCTSCHGAPPPAPHPTSTSCGTCHQGYTATSVNAATHIDGKVQVTSNHPTGYATGSVHGKDANLGGLTGCKSCHGTDLAGGSVGVSCTACHASKGFATWDTNCTFCHGNATTGVQSPPVDIQGRTVTTNVSVGVHASHVSTTIATPLTCVQCHPARTTSVITDTAHIDGNGIAEVAFGALAKTGGAAAVYTRTSATAATCGSTYCHGKFTGGANSGAGATVSWTSTTQVGCTSCHGAPPSSGQHSKSDHRTCNDCHAGYTISTVKASTHVDGVKQLGGTKIKSWNASTRLCTPTCHGSETW